MALVGPQVKSSSLFICRPRVWSVRQSVQRQQHGEQDQLLVPALGKTSLLYLINDTSLNSTTLSQYTVYLHLLKVRLVCVCVCVCGFQLCGCCITPTCCWHDLDNSEYDCWPLERPDEYNMIECGGENSQQRILNGRFKLLAHLLSSIDTLKTLDAHLMDLMKYYWLLHM